MKTEILRYLKEADGYLSGQELCERLGVSRTAVWKVIRQLQEDGYEIEAVRNRGYRLAESGDVYTMEELQSVISTRVTGKNLVFLDMVDSTNTRAKQLAEAGAPDGTLVVAETQSAAKGRRGRSWMAPAGTGVWFSLLLRPRIEPEHASMMTLVAAMAVEKGIRETTGLHGRIKWPNDVVVDGKKVCGILTEMSADMDSVNHVVVGIGINANIREFPEELREKATSLFLASGQVVKRAGLLNAVLLAWEEYYGRYLQTEDLSLLAKEYNEKLAGLHGRVQVLAPKGDYTGISHGINHRGELLVEREDGTVTEVMSGEVSVRGIYGYV